MCCMCRKFDHFRVVLLQSDVLPAELILSKFSILKLHTHLNQRIVSETFRKMCKPVAVKTEQTDKTADNKNAEAYVAE